jgi:DNA invertase Pin-like site-specific DNA recombinase
LQGLQEKGVDLFLHQQGIDTSTTAGKAMFQMLGVFAEFERGIIRERVNAGLARACQNGTKLGRRRVKPSVEATIRELRAQGDRILKIARTLGVGTSVVQGRLGNRLTLWGEWWRSNGYAGAPSKSGQ